MVTISRKRLINTRKSSINFHYFLIHRNAAEILRISSRAGTETQPVVLLWFRELAAAHAFHELHCAIN